MPRTTFSIESSIINGVLEMNICSLSINRRPPGDRILPHQLTTQPNRHGGQLSEVCEASIGSTAFMSYTVDFCAQQLEAPRRRYALRLGLGVLKRAAGARGARGAPSGAPRAPYVSHSKKIHRELLDRRV